MTVNTMEMPFRSGRCGATAPRRAAAGAHDRRRQRALQAQYKTPYVAVVKAWIGIFGAPGNAPPWGHRSAVDLKTKRGLWREVLGTARDTGLFGSRLGVPIRTGVPNLGGSIVTTGGLVFIAATTDQYLCAFDTTSGKVLRKERLSAGAPATPMTSRGRDRR